MLSDGTRKRIADFLCSIGIHLFWKEHHNERRDYRICKNYGMRQALDMKSVLFKAWCFARYKTRIAMKAILQVGKNQDPDGTYDLKERWTPLHSEFTFHATNVDAATAYIVAECYAILAGRA